MISHLHENVVEMFRERPDFAAELLADTLGISVPSFEQADVSPGDLNNVLPTEFRADLVISLTNGSEVVLAVIVEAQLSPKKEKRRSWPAYVATLHARLGCPVALLVMCPTRSVATFCAMPIAFGIPNLVLTPLVIGPDQVPAITDPTEARSKPELTILSALAYGNKSPDQKLIFEAFVAALDVLDHDHARRYAEIVVAALHTNARVNLEELMTAAPYEFKTPFFQRLEAKAEGQGMAKGMAKGKAEDVQTVLSARGIVLTDEERERISSCTDFGQLDTWLRRAVTVATTDELFS